MEADDGLKRIIKTIKKEFMWIYGYEIVKKTKETIKSYIGLKDYNSFYTYFSIGWLTSLDAKANCYKICNTGGKDEGDNL